MVTSERKMNELISKQKAIDEIKEFQSQVTCDFSKDWLNGMDEGFAHSVNVIELIDTEEAEPVRHGKWKKSGNWGRVYKCDQCGNYLDFDGVNAGRGGANYCPNCGAKMDGEEE